MVAILNRWKRKEVQKNRVLLKGKERRCKLLALDSGAHSLYTEHVINVGHANGYNWYKSAEFRKYVDGYAEFLKANKDGIDWYANVDIIFQPKMTWEVQKYLEEEHGLNPVPLVHYGTPLKWVDKYVDAGYSLLGVGGLGQEVTWSAYVHWADLLFERICPPPACKPIIRTHGFAMTSLMLMMRYPWYSTDSASWAKLAGYGSIFLPHMRHGEWDFKTYFMIAFSKRSQFSKVDGRHYCTLKKVEKKLVLDWLDFVGVPFGQRKVEPHTYGVSTEYNARAVANARYYEELAKWLPAYPWAFHAKLKTGFLEWSKVK